MLNKYKIYKNTPPKPQQPPQKDAAWVSGEPHKVLMGAHLLNRERVQRTLAPAITPPLKEGSLPLVLFSPESLEWAVSLPLTVQMTLLDLGVTGKVTGSAHIHTRTGRRRAHGMGSIALHCVWGNDLVVWTHLTSLTCSMYRFHSSIV